MSDDAEKRTFNFSDLDGDSTIEVWCEGREYDPSTEAYRPIYAYNITSPKWAYPSNDIRGGCSEVPDLAAASQSLLAFLYACQQGMAKSGRFSDESEHADLFPSHVREWAYHFAEQLELIHGELVKEIAKRK